MNSKLNNSFILVFLLVVTTLAAQAQENFTLKSAKASIQGTSSLHDWESDITKIEFKGSMLREATVLKSIKSAEVKILVEGIKSTKGKMMDNKTKDAFLYEKNPYITYTFLSSSLKTDASNMATIEATGTLTMAGVTKPIILTVKGKVLSNGDVQLSVSKKIKMTEYKMERPTAMMGTITVGDEVTVIFDLILTPGTQHAKKV